MSGGLRVMMVVDGFPPDTVGGAEGVVHGWSRELAARGHEVWVLAGRVGAPAGPDEARAGYRIRWWSSPRRTFWDGYRSAARACAAAAKKLAAEHPPGIVHLHQGLSAYAVSRAELGAPLVCTFHAPWAEEFREDAKSRAESLMLPVRPFYRMVSGLKAVRIHSMEASALARARAVATLSRFSRARIAAAHGLREDDVQILPAGVEADRFSPIPDEQRAALRQERGYAGPVLLTVRRLVRRMGIDLLIRALVPVREELPDARLIVAGKGPERASLEKLADSLGVSGAVDFAGFVPDEALPDFYRAADLFVLPTRSLEGFGVATLEALASGTPVVGTPGGATPEILSGLDENLLAREAAPEAIAETILYWLRRPDDLKALRVRARRHVEENYRWEDSGRRRYFFLTPASQCEEIYAEGFL